MSHFKFYSAHLYDADQAQIKQRVGMNNRGVNKYI